MRRLILLAALLLSPPALAETVEVFKGGVMFGGRPLTESHDAVAAALSPDGKQVAYTRRPEHGAMELWLVGRDGGPPRHVFTGRSDPDVKRDTAEINDVIFAPDGRHVYVLTTAWAVSNAVHEIRLSDGAERYVIDGNDLRVRPDGLLLVNRHGYYPKGGSYDADWLVKPDGTVVRKVSKDVR